jgi:hypothetical protein
VPVSDRAVLEQRVVTLGGLIETPGGPLGSSGGTIGARLVAGWAAERRLLERILAESQGDQVRPTIETWHDRTLTFIAGTQDDAPHWTDRAGNRWDAREVLALLDDIRERLDTWSDADQVPVSQDEELGG